VAAAVAAVVRRRLAFAVLLLLLCAPTAVLNCIDPLAVFSAPSAHFVLQGQCDFTVSKCDGIPPRTLDPSLEPIHPDMPAAPGSSPAAGAAAAAAAAGPSTPQKDKKRGVAFDEVRVHVVDRFLDRFLLVLVVLFVGLFAREKNARVLTLRRSISARRLLLSRRRRSIARTASRRFSR
jgi:hypothetical protein